MDTKFDTDKEPKFKAVARVAQYTPTVATAPILRPRLVSVQFLSERNVAVDT